MPVEECLLPLRTKSLRIDVLRLTILVNDFDAVLGHTHGDADSTRRATFEMEVFILLSVCFLHSVLEALIAGWGRTAVEEKKKNYCAVELSVPYAVWRVSRTYSNALTILQTFDTTLRYTGQKQNVLLYKRKNRMIRRRER